MPVFNSHFQVQASLEKVFAFHRNPGNLSLIQLWPRVRVVDAPRLLEAGDQMEIELGPWPRQIWKATVEELTAPHGDPAQALMVDAAEGAPFPFFRHRHHFEKEGDATRVRDTLDFELPGRALGLLLLPPVYAGLALVFWWRGLQTRRLLENRV